MKKGILTLFLFFSIGLSSIFAQCVPDTSIHTSGIFPDSATGLNAGMVNSPYNQIMQVRVPVDTLTYIGPLPVTIPIVSITLTSFTGLPPGLTYNCTPSNCIFPGGSNGCVLISGTPTAPGIYNPIAIVTTIVTIFGSNTPQVDTINYYHIDIAPSAVGIPEHKTVAFSVEQNSPNPFSDFTYLHFSAPAKSSVSLKVYNILGKEIMNKMIDASAGENNYKIDGRDLAPGIYMYSLTCAGSTITKRLIISRK